MDLEARRVMFVTPGWYADMVKAFAEDLLDDGGALKTEVEQARCDMSPPSSVASAST